MKKQEVIREYLQAKMLKAAADDIYEEAEEKVLDEIVGAASQVEGDNDNED